MTTGRGHLVLTALLVLLGLLVAPFGGVAPAAAQHAGEAEAAPQGRHGTFPALGFPGASSRAAAAPFLATPEWARFVAAEGEGWRVSYNSATGTPHRIYGRKGRSTGPIRDADAARRRARAILEEWAEVLRVDPARPLERSLGHVGRLWQVLYEDRLDGVPIRGSRILVRFSEDGGLVLLGADTFPAATVAPAAIEVSAEAALQEALRFAGLATETPPRRLDAVIYGVPDGKRRRPTRGWEIHVDDWQIFVNGGDGAVDFARPLRLHGTVTGTAAGMASPGIRPDISQNPPEALAVPFLQVLVAGVPAGISASDGSFSFFVPGTGPFDVEATLTGPFVTVSDVNGGDLSFSGVFANGVPGEIFFNSSPAELATAQVNGFIQTGRAHEFLKAIDPAFELMDFSIDCNVNLSQNCNAFYSGSSNSINFFTSGGGCPNTCYASVVHHEYGHATVNAIYGPGNWPHGSYNEGIADVLAVLFADDPQVGPDFFGVGNPVRNVDTQDRVYPDDVDNEIHDAGLIVGGAFWDTRVELAATLGDPAALEQTRTLFLGSLQLQPEFITPELTIDVLMVDDDDGDLSNGTPNYLAIAAGFGAHGLDAPSLPNVILFPDELGDVFDDLVPNPLAVDVATLRGTVTAVTFHYSTDDGDSYTVVPLADAGGGLYTGTLAPIVSPAVLHYYFRAENDFGDVSTAPAAAPLDDHFVSRIGHIVTTLRQEDFEGPTDAGWSHLAEQGVDDWERGAPNPDGDHPYDPVAAFSGVSVWGNDLDGDYAPNSVNLLSAPAADASGLAGLRVRYRRWLSVEDATFDQALVRVNDVEIWQNRASGPGNDHTVDVSWTLHDHDVAALADDQPSVVVEFRLDSDGGLEFGGWNLDDFELYSLVSSDFLPEVSAIEPSAGPLVGGTEVFVFGANFVAGVTEILIDGVALENAVVNGSGSVIGTVPAGVVAGAADVVAANGSRVGAPLVDGFVYLGVPTVTAIDPASGYLPGGQSVAIAGDGFHDAATTVVRIGGAEASFAVIDPQTISALTPSALASGAVTVEVETVMGVGALVGGFEYLADPAVTLSAPLDFPVPVAAPAPCPLAITSDTALDGLALGLQWDAAVLDGVALVATGGLLEGAGFFAPTIDNGAGTLTLGVVMDISPPFTEQIPAATDAALAFLELAVDPGVGEGSTSGLDWTDGLGSPPVTIGVVVDALEFTPDLASGSAVVVAGGFTFIRGDTSGDGAVALNDVLVLLNHLFSGGPLACQDTGDFDDGGTLGLSDAIGLLGYLFQDGPPPAPPFPDPGPDPTDDDLECAP